MMANVYSIDGKKIGTITLPSQFKEEIRADLIKRAVIAIQSHKRQAYGSDTEAGQRSSAKFHARRQVYGSWANRGMARISRVKWGSGYITGRGRITPQATKGRRAHPPKVEKKWEQKINDKERKKAIRSAIAATADKEIIKVRGHLLNEIELPLIIEDKFETLNKTKQIEEALKKIGLNNELSRTDKISIRAGKGKTRDRKYHKRKGPLVVVVDEKNVKNAAENIRGIDVCKVNNLNAELLAPGIHAGRLTIWTKGAIEKMEKEKLFY